MFNKSEESPPPDTIWSSGNFLMLQEDLLSQIKPVSVGIPSPPETTLQVRDGLLGYKSKILIPEDLRVSTMGLCIDHY